MSPRINGRVELVGRVPPFNILEPTVALSIAGPNREFQSLDCVVDTGFNGLLSLPESVVADLGLARHGSRDSRLADGQMVRTVTYWALLLWNDRIEDIIIHQSGSVQPLIGTSMLENCRLTIDMWPGGRVTIDLNP